MVWVRFQLDEDPLMADLTSVARDQIEEYVDRTFGTVVGSDNVRQMSD